MLVNAGRADKHKARNDIAMYWIKKLQVYNISVNKPN